MRPSGQYLIRKIVTFIPTALKRFVAESFLNGKTSFDRLRAKRLDYEKSLHITPVGKNVFVYTMVPWVHSHIEYTLGKVFQYHGFHVTHVICGGDLPVCGMENIKTQRPLCSDCIYGAEKFPRAYGVTYVRLNEIVEIESYNVLFLELNETSPEEIYEFTYEGIPYGQLCLDDYSQYRQDKTELRDMVDQGAREVWVKGIASQVLLHDAVSNLHQSREHHLAIVANGKSFAYTGIYQCLRKNNIDTITWDETPSYYNSFIFKENDYANEVHIDDLFSSLEEHIGKVDYRSAVDRYFKAWIEDGHHTFKYYNSQVVDPHRIQKELGINFSRFEKIVSLYTNVTWDTAALRRDRGFSTMMDWIKAFVRAVSNKNEILLLIRSHPAEDKVPNEFRSMTTVRDGLLREYGDLPENVCVIPGASDISSYALCEISDVNSVYTSTVGFEFALRGYKPYVAGLVHYGSKGFTGELLHKNEVPEVLRLKKQDTRLSVQQIDLAYKYAYVWLFVSLFRPSNLVRSRDRYLFEEYSALVSKGSEYYDLFSSIINHKIYSTLGLNSRAITSPIPAQRS